MKFSRIALAIIAILIIAAIILMRAPLEAVFTTSEEEKTRAATEQSYKDAQNAVDNAQKALERAKTDVETREDALKQANETRDKAKKELENIGQSPEEIAALTEADQRLLRVEAIRSNAQEIAAGIALSGQVEAERKLEVRAETSGQVISEPIASGTFVNKEDVLCELDPGTRQASLDQANAALQTARTQYQSTESLKKRGLASTAALQSAYASLEQAQSVVKSAEREIERLQIRAPFDGVLENQTAELGTLLQSGSTCASIIALDRLLLVGYAPETQVDRIVSGAQAVGKLRDGSELAGEVTFIGATAEGNTRTYRTEVSVENSGNIRDGESVRIEIALAGTKGHLIPSNAITLDDDGTLGVKISENDGESDFVRFMPVDVVRDTPEGIWITGLPDQAYVIIEGQEYAIDGQQVETFFHDEEKS